MRIAVKTKNIQILQHTINGIIESDRYFTIPGVVIITAGGIMAAIHGHFPILRTGWIFWSIILFIISGLAFSIKVAPLQKRIRNLLLNSESLTDSAWVEFYKMYTSWDIWGIIALITPLVAFVMMTLKMPR